MRGNDRFSVTTHAEGATKIVRVFALAIQDEQLAQEIEVLLTAWWQRKGRPENSVVWVLAGWLPNPSAEDFARIRAFGQFLTTIGPFHLRLLSPEASMEDVARYALEPLYITGRLLTAGVPVFDLDNLEAGLEQLPDAQHQDAWVNILCQMGPGPGDVRAWRHDIRGRILGTVNLYLQANPADFEDTLLSESMGEQLRLWQGLASMEPYRSSQPAVAKAVEALLESIIRFRSEDERGRPPWRAVIRDSADVLGDVLDAAHMG